MSLPTGSEHSEIDEPVSPTSSDAPRETAPAASDSAAALSAGADSAEDQSAEDQAAGTELEPVESEPAEMESAEMEPTTTEPAGSDAASVGSRDTVAEQPVSARSPVALAVAPDAPTAEEPKQWFVLKVQSNRERTIRDSLLRRIRRDGLEQYFGDIVIPTEKIVETKNGKKRTTERKLYPGYIMVNMVLNDETWYLVRDTGGVGDFTGAAGKPLPMRDEEIAAMIQQGEEKPDEQPKVKITFAGGDAVKIKEGTFENFEGTVEKVDEASGKINVLIEIFGRPTPVELEYWQVERM